MERAVYNGGIKNCKMPGQQQFKPGSILFKATLIQSALFMIWLFP
jgi:hypothetical protein